MRRFYSLFIISLLLIAGSCNKYKDKTLLGFWKYESTISEYYTNGEFVEKLTESQYSTLIGLEVKTDEITEWHSEISYSSFADEWEIDGVNLLAIQLNSVDTLEIITLDEVEFSYKVKYDIIEAVDSLGQPLKTHLIIKTHNFERVDAFF